MSKFPFGELYKGEHAHNYYYTTGLLGDTEALSYQHAPSRNTGQKVRHAACPLNWSGKLFDLFHDFLKGPK